MTTIASRTPNTRKLELDDYLSASADASQRTRLVNTTLLIACVLLFVGWLNALPNQWLLSRLHSLADVQSDYTVSKLGPFPLRSTFSSDTSFRDASSLYSVRYNALYDAVAARYVDTAMTVQVPFFGFTLDMNDLGVLGGLCLVIVLAAYAFCIARELDNLRLYFSATVALTSKRDAYYLLAMRQVFTVPTTPGRHPGVIARHSPKVLCWLPFAVMLLILINDHATDSIAIPLSISRFSVTIWVELLSLCIVVALCLLITVRLKEIDGQWDAAWNALPPLPLEPGA